LQFVRRYRHPRRFAAEQRTHFYCPRGRVSKLPAIQRAQRPKVDIWRFRDGKAVEFYEMFDTTAAFAAATP
jgi:hypothetical protein